MGTSKFGRIKNYFLYPLLDYTALNKVIGADT